MDVELLSIVPVTAVRPSPFANAVIVALSPISARFVDFTI